MKKPTPSYFNWREVRSISFKIRGLAYLLRNHTNDPCPRLDLSEIYWGVGQLLDELAESLNKIAKNADTPRTPGGIHD